MGKQRCFLVRALALGLAFAALKLLSVACSEHSAGQLVWSALPWLITFDLLAAAGVASLVFVSPGLHSCVAYLSLIYYVAALHYQRFFGDFFTWRTLEFTYEMGALRSSVAEILDWRLLTALPLLMLFYGVTASRPLASRRVCVTVVTVWLVLVVGTWRAPDLHYYQVYRANPLTRLAASTVEALRADRVDPSLAVAKPGSFDADTVFER
ncbi:MAG: hypothetical protein GX589_10290, partial [Deltaproteobacteria bacterium]|nr:hypothetical protein [Deltaproteobacteria bacterium]